MKTRYTSRSAILTFNTCHLKRYLQYHINETGVVSEKYPLDLLIGSTVHRGLQHLLEHCRLEHPTGDFQEKCIDEAVEKAYELWRETIAGQSLWFNSSSEEQYLSDILAEQECLFEGLIRAFAIHKLPGILIGHEILEVEHEEVYEDFTTKIECDNCHNWTILKENCKVCNGVGSWHPVIFLGKADGLFRRKVDNKLVILSIKTSSEYAEVTTRNILHDMQGVSEWVIIQDRLEKQFIEYQRIIKLFNGQGLYDEFVNIIGFNLANYFLECNANGIEPKIFAVQYEYLLKGKRRQYPYGSGIYKQDSFLIHPLKQDGLMMIGNRGTSFSTDEYKWKKPSGRLSKGWSQIDIYNDIGIKNWIELLATGQIQPEEGHPFDSILKTSDLIVRSQTEIEEWKISMAFQEELIGKYLDEIDSLVYKLDKYEADLIEDSDKSDEFINNLKKEIQTKIQQYFPKNTQSCHNYYGKDCVFVTNCHENVSVEDAISAGILIPRQSHHEMEREALDKINE